jgi:hypothetical protein
MNCLSVFLKKPCHWINQQVATGKDKQLKIGCDCEKNLLFIARYILSIFYGKFEYPARMMKKP